MTRDTRGSRAGTGSGPVAVAAEGGVTTVRLDRPEAMNALDVAPRR